MEDEIPIKNMKKAKLNSNEDNVILQGAGVDAGKKKPRILIKLRPGSEKSDATESKKDKNTSLKRKRESSMQGTDDAIKETGTETVAKKLKKDAGQSTKKKVSRKGEDNDTKSTSAAGPKDDLPIFLNLKFWKQSRESLNGTFKSARKNLTQFDSWVLPPGIPDDKFADIANSTLDKMNKYVVAEWLFVYDHFTYRLFFSFQA